MWLLDANMDVLLKVVLSELGVSSEAAGALGWKALSNGQLVAAAVAEGFDCLLTRVRLFGESASRTLRAHQAFAVVLVTLPQRRWLEYRQSFLDAWTSCPIVPQPGTLIEWPQDHRPQS